MQLEVKKGQSIYDLSIIYGYGMDSIIKFIQLSGLDSLNNINISGSKIDVTLNPLATADKLILQNSKLNTGIEDDINYIVDDSDNMLGDNNFALVYK